MTSSIIDTSRLGRSLWQPGLFDTHHSTVAMTPEIEQLLATQAAVACGVSGGKDSVACALATDEYLNEIGHTGPRLLIHADLGRVEWKDSFPSCERLAAHLGWELKVVRRQAGDMLSRWQGRWANNVARYADLSCVKLILPWSTPSLRFCTSELKASTIASELNKRYREQHILNVVGIRREESTARSRMPVSARLDRLTKRGRTALTWNAIIDWKATDVFSRIRRAGLRLHEAYETYGSSRVSCCFCIMSSADDLLAAAGCADNHDVYREMVALEIRSTFAFQSTRWLGDVAPHLLTDDMRRDLAAAKVAAQQRQDAEARLPEHLLFTRRWPASVPTHGEAGLIAAVRRDVARAVGIEVRHTSAQQVRDRYAELLALKGDREAAPEESCEAFA